MTHTIYALASGAGVAGVAVIRLSGDHAFAVAETLLKKPLPAPNTTALRHLYHPQTDEFLDDVLILPFKSPHSFTGEDVVEIHAHGGRAVLNAIFNALAIHPNTRMADPGEYTRRAVQNNKMDLTTAEGILDLIHADTESQRKQALRQSQGELGKLYTTWADKLVPVLAHAEAYIDFPDEEIPQSVYSDLMQTLNTIATQMADHLNDNTAGEMVRGGITMAIFGPPNAGKSSLLNTLAKRDVAIVSDTAGTTRDVIQTHLDIGGYAVTVADTAGIRTTDDDIESQGVKRALFTTQTADFKILVLDSTDGDSLNHVMADITPHIDQNTYILLNKSDQSNPQIPAEILPPSAGVFAVSVQTGDGITEFFTALTNALNDRIGTSETPLITRARHRESITQSLSHITNAQTAPELELMAEDVRLAVRELGRITGTVGVEDLLDIVFRDFCIGK